MSFPARYTGTCATCGKEIKVGQHISWSRRERGKAYHADCANPDAIPGAVTAPTAATITPETIVALIKALVPTAAAPVIEEEPTEEEMTKTTVAAAAPAITPIKTKPKNPKLSNSAEWFDVLGALCQALRDGALNKLRVLVVGPPGTGKSHTSEILSNAMFRVPIHQGMGVEELIGQYHLESGSTIWKDDVITTAMKEGRSVVIDEIDRYSDEIASIFYGMLDDRPYVKTGEGKIIKAEKGFSVFATMNPSVTALTDALLDRFDVILTAITPHPDANQYTGENAAAMQGAVANYFQSVSKATWAWSAKPTVRKMRSFQMLEPIIGRKHALAVVFGDAAAEVESALTTSGVTK